MRISSWYPQRKISITEKNTDIGAPRRVQGPRTPTRSSGLTCLWQASSSIQFPDRDLASLTSLVQPQSSNRKDKPKRGGQPGIRPYSLVWHCHLVYPHGRIPGCPPRSVLSLGLELCGRSGGLESIRILMESCQRYVRHIPG